MKVHGLPQLFFFLAGFTFLVLWLKRRGFLNRILISIGAIAIVAGIGFMAYSQHYVHSDPVSVPLTLSPGEKAEFTYGAPWSRRYEVELDIPEGRLGEIKGEMGLSQYIDFGYAFTGPLSSEFLYQNEEPPTHVGSERRDPASIGGWGRSLSVNLSIPFLHKGELQKFSIQITRVGAALLGKPAKFWVHEYRDDLVSGMYIGASGLLSLLLGLILVGATYFFGIRRTRVEARSA